MPTKLIDYITLVSWVSAVISGIIILIQSYGYFTYSETDRLMDIHKYGMEASFSIIKPSIVFILSVCWIYVF